MFAPVNHMSSFGYGRSPTFRNLLCYACRLFAAGFGLLLKHAHLAQDWTTAAASCLKHCFIKNATHPPVKKREMPTVCEVSSSCYMVRNPLLMLGSTCDNPDQHPPHLLVRTDFAHGMRSAFETGCWYCKSLRTRVSPKQQELLSCYKKASLAVRQHKVFLSRRCMSEEICDIVLRQGPRNHVWLSWIAGEPAAWIWAERAQHGGFCWSCIPRILLPGCGRGVPGNGRGAAACPQDGGLHRGLPCQAGSSLPGGVRQRARCLLPQRTSALAPSGHLMPSSLCYGFKPRLAR